MANLTRWAPFSARSPLAGFPVFEDLLRGFPTRSAWADDSTPEIRLELTEDDKAFHVRADIPGVAKDDISVSVEGSLLTISADVKKEVERKDERSLFSERSYGSSYRSFTLPSPIDDSKTVAHYQDGVLTLTLPKAGNGRGKRITVS